MFLSWCNYQLVFIKPVKAGCVNVSVALHNITSPDTEGGGHQEQNVQAKKQK